VNETIRKKIREPLEKHKRPEAKDEVRLRGHLGGLFLFLLLGLGEVGGLLLFVALLVSGSFVIVWLAVGLAESLPLVTKLLANLSCRGVRYVQ
jgi:hypothetical protein